MTEEMRNLIGAGIVLYPPTEKDRIRNERSGDVAQSVMVEGMREIFGNRWPSEG